VKEKKRVEFTETMSGHLSFDLPPLKSKKKLTQTEFIQLYQQSSNQNDQDSFTLTIKVDDLDSFIFDSDLEAPAEGSVTIAKFGGTFSIKQGKFNLFVTPDTSTGLNTSKEMHYHLYFSSIDGTPYTLYGFKEIEREDFSDMWDETTTLYTYIWKGHQSYSDVAESAVVGAGILKISLTDFLEQMTTFKCSGDNFVSRSSSLIRFLTLFAGNLWESYAPFFFGTDRVRWNEHLFPLHTLEGVRGCQKEMIPFPTDDGLNLILHRFKRQESKNVVLLLHGLTTSTDMFVMPEHYNMTQFMLDNGIDDIWSLDWRGSNRYHYNLEPHRYTIDDVAIYDIPAAIKVMHQQLGEDVNIHIVAHCVGSIALMASLSSGLLPGVKSVVSNSVSLTPRVTTMSRLKLMFAPTLIEYIFGYPYISPKMAYYPGPGFGRWIHWMERLIRRECKEPACHMVSFMWGWGFPAAYLHKNLSPITHRRLADLFGGTSVNYYRHIGKMLKKKVSLPYKSEGAYANLPTNYLEGIKDNPLPPTLFFSGDQNLIFPQSNQTTYQEIKKIAPEAPVEYCEFQGYGHQDVFMGKNCDKEVFPTLVAFIKQNFQ
jgi:cholesterol oxidase